MIAITQIRRPVVPTLSFDRDSMQTIGQTAIETELSRLATATNINDQPAKPLSAAYERRKRKAGGEPVRDLHLSGSMLASREVIRTVGGSVTVGFSDPHQTSKAAINESLEKMLGLSAADKTKIDTEIRKEFSGKFKELVRG